MPVRIPSEVRARLTARLTQDGVADPVGAVEAAEEFLILAAAGGVHHPSPLADVGWHVFLLHTRDYAAFCDQLGGFIHHEPLPAGDCENHCNSCRSAPPKAALPFPNAFDPEE